MAIVAGVEFGTLSVRVTLLDSDRGRLGTASSEYPLERRREDPNFRNTVAYRTDARVGAGNSTGARGHQSSRRGYRLHRARHNPFECRSGTRSHAATG